MCKLSAIYETAPFGVSAADRHPPYLNMVAEIRVTSVSPSQMLARMLRIEYLLGRRDKNQNKPRTVDLDLLLFGNIKYHTDLLTVPHPRLHERRFVLVPLAELAPHVVHPILHREIIQILHQVADDSTVKRWNPLISG